MRRLLDTAPKTPPVPAMQSLPLARAYCDWLLKTGRAAEADRCRGYGARAVTGQRIELPGPVGESNIYELRPRGRILLMPSTDAGLLLQLGAVLATGNSALFDSRAVNADLLKDLPSAVAENVVVAADWTKGPVPAAALVEGDEARVRAVSIDIAAIEGPVIPVQGLSSADLAGGADYSLEGLVEERAISINTTAAGGNASLMALEI